MIRNLSPGWGCACQISAGISFNFHSIFCFLEWSTQLASEEICFNSWVQTSYTNYLKVFYTGIFLPYNWIVKSFIYIGVNLWILILKLEFSPVLFLFCSNCYSFGSRLLCPFGIPINIFCLFLFLALFLIFGTIRWLRLIFYIWSPSSKILSNFTNVHVYRTIPHSVGNIAQPPLRKASGERGPAHRTHVHGYIHPWGIRPALYLGCYETCFS